jgi:hypothetical protein
MSSKKASSPNSFTQKQFFATLSEYYNKPITKKSELDRLDQDILEKVIENEKKYTIKQEKLMKSIAQSIPASKLNGTFKRSTKPNRKTTIGTKRKQSNDTTERTNKKKYKHSAKSTIGTKRKRATSSTYKNTKKQKQPIRVTLNTKRPKTINFAFKSSENPERKMQTQNPHIMRRNKPLTNKDYELKEFSKMSLK